MKHMTQPKLTKKDSIELSNDILADLMKAVLQQGGKFKFQAKGASMSPFIRDGDILTLIPIEKGEPTIGNVIACLSPQTQKLIIHRIIATEGTLFLIKGDNSLTQADGWIPKEQIIGLVAKVEREGREVKTGLGIGRWLIVFLSKNGLLPRIINRLRWIFR